MFLNIEKAIVCINDDLARLKEDFCHDTFDKVKNFVIHFSYLDLAEINVFSAL